MSDTKSYTVEEAKQLLERYCVYRERCHKEVLQKLRTLRMVSDAQEFILLHLLKHNFLNEERFAKSFARGKFSNNKWGKNKIVTALKQKDISTYNINTALCEINNDDYHTTLVSLLKNKMASLHEKNTYALRKKVTNYLLQKGFELSLIVEILNKELKKSN